MQKLLTAIQEAKFNAARATEQHVDANLAVISGIPAFLALYNQIKAKIAAIGETAQLKGGSLSGIATGKSGLRQTLTAKTLVISGIVYTYAADIGDQTLKAEMDIKQSRLTRTRDEELAPLCQFVHDRAQTHRAALADYNITASDLTALQTAIDNYKADVPKPRTALSNRKTVNANIRTHFKELNDFFKRFDRQIESLTQINPNFVSTYFSTREIVDPPTKSKKVGNIPNSGNGETPQ